MVSLQQAATPAEWWTPQEKASLEQGEMLATGDKLDSCPTRTLTQADP